MYYYNFQSTPFLSTFEENSGGRAGVLAIGYLPVTFSGTNLFKNNSGRILVVSIPNLYSLISLVYISMTNKSIDFCVIQISGSQVEIKGSVQFSENNQSSLGLESGALYIISFGQIILFSGAELIFRNNSGV